MESIIQVDNIVKSFGSKEVLKGVSFHVNKGEILVVVGKSGSGKSVIFKHLVSLLQPDRGTISISDSSNIFDLSIHELNKLRHKFGVAFQMSALFDSLTIFENVAFGLQRLNKGKKISNTKLREIVKDKLALVGLKDVEDKKPASLSGGMQKRVAIARAIAYNPEIILYDEPTTGLDPIMAAVIDDLIMSLNKELNITSIVVSHDMQSVFKIANRVVMLYEGKIIFEDEVSKFKNTKDPLLRQFIEGTQDGPIQVI